MYCRRFPHLRTVQSHSFHSSSHVKALGALAIQKAERISSQWKGTSATGGTTKNFIGGEFVESKTTEWIDAHDPVCNTLNRSYFQTNEYTQSTQTLLTRVPQTTNSEFMAAIEAASHAYKSWSRTSVVTRQRFVLEYVSYILT